MDQKTDGACSHVFSSVTNDGEQVSLEKTSDTDWIFDDDERDSRHVGRSAHISSIRDLLLWCQMVLDALISVYNVLSNSTVFLHSVYSSQTNGFGTVMSIWARSALIQMT